MTEEEEEEQKQEKSLWGGGGGYLKNRKTRVEERVGNMNGVLGEQISNADKKGG